MRPLGWVSSIHRVIAPRFFAARFPNRAHPQSKNQRIRESENQRIRESENQRIRESKNQRIRESKNQSFRAARPPTPAALLARPLQARFRVWTGLLVASTLAHTSSPRPQHAPLSTHQGVPLMLCNLICDQFERYSSGLCSSFSQRDFRISPPTITHNHPESPACLDPTLRRHGVMVRRDM